MEADGGRAAATPEAKVVRTAGDAVVGLKRSVVVSKLMKALLEDDSGCLAGRCFCGWIILLLMFVAVVAVVVAISGTASCWSSQPL